MRKILLAVNLALKDWLNEFSLSVCSVFALMSILTPLLILHGIHFGVIETFKDRLMTDPTILVIMPAGGKGAGFTQGFIEEIRQRPEVTFAVGRTRDVAAELQLYGPKNKFLTVSLEPSGLGDPLLKRAGVHPPESSTGKFLIDLSASAAKKLGVKEGGVIKAGLSRRKSNGKAESLNIELTVAGIIPTALIGTDTAFVSENLLYALQDYRDNISSTLLNVKGEKEPGEENHFESFRVYSKDLDSVPRLQAWFDHQNIIVKTRAKDIANLRQLDNSLNYIVLTISSAALLGFLAFMFSTVSANVKRKQKMLSILRLLGMEKIHLMLYPITQSAAMVTLGCLGSFIAFYLISYAINKAFRQQTGGDTLCVIPIIHLLGAFFVTLFLAVLAALPSAYKASRINPSDVIRQL